MSCSVQLALALSVIALTARVDGQINHTVVWLLNDDNVETDIAGKAKVSGKLTIDPMKMGARLDDFNIIMPDVPRDLVTFKPHWSRDTHLFGIATGPETIELSLTCDDGVEGALNGTGHSDVYETHDGYGRWHRNHPDLPYHEEDELGPYQTVSTLLDIKISNFAVDEDGMTIAQSLQLLDSPTDTTINATIVLKVIVWINPTLDQRRVGLIPSRIVIEDQVRVEVVVVPHPDEAASYPFDVTFRRELCVQPIRFNYSTGDCIRYETHSRMVYRRVGWWWRRRAKQVVVYYKVCVEYDKGLTGTGFELASAPATVEWDKVNIDLTWKPFKTIHTEKQYHVIVNAGKEGTSLSEQSVLQQENDDDCVEVFFIKDFNPSDAHGGAAVWNPGTASAKAIVADSHILCNQSTVLAHLIGHVLGLKHSGNESDGFQAGTDGTVLCPSTEDSDSPPRNSVENGLNVNNPLVQWSVRFTEGGTPDCGGDIGSCGTCEDHAGRVCETETD